MRVNVSQKVYLICVQVLRPAQADVPRAMRCNGEVVLQRQRHGWWLMPRAAPGARPIQRGEAAQGLPPREHGHGVL